jgi:hypothetical protein
MVFLNELVNNTIYLYLNHLYFKYLDNVGLDRWSERIFFFFFIINTSFFDCRRLEFLTARLELSGLG